MGNILIYKVEKYRSEYFRIFSGVYEDFRSKAKSKYNFELEPLNYEDFIKSISDELIQCLCCSKMKSRRDFWSIQH